PCNPWPNGLRADRSQPAADVPTWAADRPEEPHHRSGPPTFSARAGRACAAPSGRHVPPGEAERRVLPARRGGVYTPTGPRGPARTAPAPPRPPAGVSTVTAGRDPYPARITARRRAGPRGPRRTVPLPVCGRPRTAGRRPAPAEPTGSPTD